jgi:ABC-type glycerol-3-phosphate transport system permease component
MKSPKQLQISQRPAAQIWLTLIYIFLIVFSVITLIPFFWVVSASLKDNADFFSSLFLPTGDGVLGIAWDRLTLKHFFKLFTEIGIGQAALNSIFLASATSVLATICSAMGGYALSKYNFSGRTFITTMVLSALIIPGPLLLAPGYKLLYNLGLLNSYAGLILPHMAPAFGVFLFRQSMLNAVPRELLESARIDGAGEIRIFFNMVIPIVRPMIGAYLIITFLASWNNFIAPQIVLQSPEKLPLAVAINNLKGTYTEDYGMLMAGTVISVAPMLILFLLMQKEFISGLTSGAVKG